DRTVDLRREVRVARVIPDTGILVEVPSQVYGEARRGHERLCRMVFFADAPAHGTVTYLILYGNPCAELTAYTTDLRVAGEGYGLDVENHHYVARLSRQTGQLERLTYKRQHGLELYAGGKGHGEPPTIDWANDYVDHDGFQKFRIRNWSECPNYEVVRGPLCVRVRRWGFPHSPVHPLFTPSRMHVDQTYVFYAGKEFFIKEGTMDAVKDFRISAMRDDEWVLSGYSFTNTVWMDGEGKLHEGGVPSEQAENLWGVGFFNPTSRDAFIALWLDHSAVNFEGLRHSGSPTLHYPQHGQLWSRYPADGDEGALEAGASIRQRNAYLVSSYPENDAAGRIERLRRQLLNPLVVHTDGSPAVDDANATGTLARDGETLDTAPLKPRIWRALREVKDEQLYRVDANIVDMGYVYDVSIRDGVVHVLLTMPHRGRPVYDYFVTQGGGHTTEGIRERLLRIEGIRDVVVDSTWNPPWTVARLTDAGQQAMGL
ncbi:MAG: metal-sulfur cluster assembly factor, partial [Planctomycetota bacterium]